MGPATSASSAVASASVGHAARKQGKITADMDRLKKTLSFLLDESRPVEQRLDGVSKGGNYYISGLGRAILTPILMCVYPDKYAVYNNRSEAGLEKLRMFTTKKTDSLARRYAAVNQACHDISQRIGQPLHLVDSMLSLITHEASPLLDGEGEEDADLGPAAISAGEPPEKSDAGVDERLTFPMEKFLQEFLEANWDKTELGRRFELHQEDDESALEYATDVGRIDILARERQTRDWVVIELKRAATATRFSANFCVTWVGSSSTWRILGRT